MQGKILLTGASGQLGQSFQRIYKNNNLYFLKSRLENLCSLREEVKRLNPDFVFHFGAWTNVDACSLDINRSRLVNFASTQVINESIRQTTPFVYVSTDYVFDGKSGPYKENDPNLAINIYGYHKLLSEKYLLEQKKELYVVRTNAVYYGDEGRDFVSRTQKSLKQNQEVRIPEDEFVSPTFVDDLSSFILDKVITSDYGIYHGAGPEILSRFAIAERIATIFNLNKHLIVPISSENLKRPAVRPLKGGLLNTKLESRFKSLEEVLLRLRSF